MVQEKFHLNHKKIAKYIQNPVLFLITVFITLFCMAKGFQFNIAHYEIYSVLFTIIIINFAENRYKWMNLEFKPLRYLGVISFGIYVYHAIAIVIALRFLEKIGNVNDLFLYPLVFILSIFMAWLSYEFFEKKFLYLKVKFSGIKTGDATFFKE